jgi:hypothetical protein
MFCLFVVKEKVSALAQKYIFLNPNFFSPVLVTGKGLGLKMPHHHDCVTLMTSKTNFLASSGHAFEMGMAINSSMFKVNVFFYQNHVF